MKLYRGVIESYATDDIIWEFEAENDSQAISIVDEMRLKLGMGGIIKKKLYQIGVRVK